MDEVIRMAIAKRRLLAFELHGHPRIGEPHDYGVIKGVPTLFFYPIGGESRSGKPIGWRRAVTDHLIATVSPRS